MRANGLHQRDLWITSDTFLEDVYSGDPARLSSAFKRFVEARLPIFLNQIQNALPSHWHSETEDIAQNLLIELHKDITKGWRHPEGTRFGQCVGQLAKDAISVAKRRISRSSEVELNEAVLRPTCADLVSGFWRVEVLNAAESRVKVVTTAPHWQVYESWKKSKGMSSDLDSGDDPDDISKTHVQTDSERKILSRVRQAILAEIEGIAKRGGFEPQELLLERL